MTTIIPFAIGALGILVFGAGWVVGYKSKKEAPCDTCKHLTKKGGTWKYYCNGFGWEDCYDKPPEYCKKYKKREGET